jgi:hypothetical protein
MNLPVTSKTETAALPLRSKKSLSINNTLKKIRLVLNNGAVPDETLVCLVNDATLDFDGDYDAYKLFSSGTTTPFIYSELNSIKYALNVVPEPISDAEIIPVSVVLKTAGTYKIDVTEFENLQDIKVVLKHGAVETNLSQDASYSFTADAGTYNDFELIIGGTITGLYEFTKENLKCWYSKNYLYINCPDEITADKSSLVVYDLQGKPVYRNDHIYITAGQTVQFPVNLTDGVYITRVFANNKSFVSKFVVF